MEFIPFSHVAKMELIFLENGQVAENVIYYQAPGPITASKLQDAAVALVNTWLSTARVKVSMNTSLTRVKGSDMTTQDGETTEWDVVPPAAGSQGSNSYTSANSVLIKFTTAKRGRSYRGRLYMIGSHTATWSGNVLDPQTRTPYQAFAEALMSLTVGTETWLLVIASRQLNGVRRAVGVATEVIGANVQEYPVTQRRRLPGHGL